MIENLIKEIVNDNTEETFRKSSKLSQEMESIYRRISIHLNIHGISNKLLNIKDLYGLTDYYFILVKENENNEYYLIDLNLDNNVVRIDDKLFNKYLMHFEVLNNRLTLNDIYETRTNAR